MTAGIILSSAFATCARLRGSGRSGDMSGGDDPDPLLAGKTHGRTH